jgi:hypothetical protein
MWTRIGLDYPVWFEPKVLACYREHPDNETARLRKHGDNVRDIEQCILIMKSYMPDELLPTLGAGMYEILRDDALASATEYLLAQDRRQGIAKFHEAMQYDTSLRFSSVRLAYYKWYVKLWLQEQLGARTEGKSADQRSDNHRL